MTIENLIFASYVISLILIGGISLGSYITMRRTEASLNDLKDEK